MIKSVSTFTPKEQQLAGISSNPFGEVNLRIFRCTAKESSRSSFSRPGCRSAKDKVLFWRTKFSQIVLASLICVFLPWTIVFGFDADDDPAPVWEPLLWGGSISGSMGNKSAHPMLGSQGNEGAVGDSATIAQYHGFTRNSRLAPNTILGSLHNPPDVLAKTSGPAFIAPPDRSVLLMSEVGESDVYYRGSFRNLVLKNIPPLYLTPELPGEGIWEWRGLPTDRDGRPLMYSTSYRPSEKYPNAIAHMLLFDMKRLSMKLYIGSTEPGGSRESSIVEQGDRKRLVAVTNALWKQRHSGDAGTIVSGKVIRDLYPGMATLATYKDGSVDVLEWSNGVPTSMVTDAKQLRHLIVRDGKVVDWIISGGRQTDSEIGLGHLLSESEPMPGYQYWGGWWGPASDANYGTDWFIATRSAFGIRRDGNLVFAVGHHISTRDLAKALVLAGCDRAIHGDANPHNVLANIYFTDGNGNFVRKERLSPDQKTYTLDRYVDRSYTSDFYAFFTRLD
ncbi:MAG: hypothetical protein NTW27_02865 [Deltaproteobacteria bacterium]|nr:hypothetical protein [Deltaproteobacteria bacterium]